MVTRSDLHSVRPTFLTEIFQVFYSGGLASGLAPSTPSFYDTARFGSSSAAVLESLGAQLKQKEGELGQLQLLLGEQSRLRENMNKEMTRLTIQAEQVAVEEDPLRHFLICFSCRRNQ